MYEIINSQCKSPLLGVNISLLCFFKECGLIVEIESHKSISGVHEKGFLICVNLLFAILSKISCNYGSSDCSERIQILFKYKINQSVYNSSLCDILS